MNENELNIIGMRLRFDTMIFGADSRLDISSIKGFILSKFEFRNRTWIDFYKINRFLCISDLYENIRIKEKEYKDSLEKEIENELEFAQTYMNLEFRQG